MDLFKEDSEPMPDLSDPNCSFGPEPFKSLELYLQTMTNTLDPETQPDWPGGPDGTPVETLPTSSSEKVVEPDPGDFFESCLDESLVEMHESVGRILDDLLGPDQYERDFGEELVDPASGDLPDRESIGSALAASLSALDINDNQHTESGLLFNNLTDANLK
jgi:hypothetical protein